MTELKTGTSGYISSEEAKESAVPSKLTTTHAPTTTKQPPSVFGWLSPLNNPETWRRAPMYKPPKDVDIARAQKEIDSIVGVTRENRSIIKLAWNGDRRYWLKFYASWDALGRPNAPLVERPLVRRGAILDGKRLVRDIFPPRWLLLIRLEPEQYAATWKQESYFFAPEINAYKQIRPDEPPKEFWLPYATIARHTDYCCGIAEKNKRRCYGEYAPPSYVFDNLGEQKRACEKLGLKDSPFQMIDAETASEIADENNGYLDEIRQMEIESEVYAENPLALIGIVPSIKADVDAKKAGQIVRDFYDREIQKTAKLIK